MIISSDIECIDLGRICDPEMIRQEIEDLDEVFYTKKINGYDHELERATSGWKGIALINSTGYQGSAGVRDIGRPDRIKQTKTLQKSDTLTTLINKVERKFDTVCIGARVLKLERGSVIGCHSDGANFGVDRYRCAIPIVSHYPNVWLTINSNHYFLKPGSLYYTNVSAAHSAYNLSPIDRLHIVLDLLPSSMLNNAIEDGHPAIDKSFSPPLSSIPDVSSPSSQVHRSQKMSTLKEIMVGSVNGRDVSLNEILYGLKISNSLGDLTDALREIVMLDAIHRDGITASEDELQAAADELRADMGLFSASQTGAWLREVGLTVDDFEEYLRRRISTRKLKEKISEGKTEAFFKAHRPKFDSARLSQVVLDDEEKAREIKDDAAAGADFSALARQYSTDNASRAQGGFIGSINRSAMPAAIAKAVFSAKDGDVVGPTKIDGKYHVVKVEEITRAELNDDMQPAIREAIFAEWLQAEVERASTVNDLPSLISPP